MLPYLSEISSSRRLVQQFYGYSHTLHCPEGYFYDICDLSAEDFPVLSTRKEFLRTDNLFSLEGITGKDKLAFVGNGTLYYDGEPIKAGLSSKPKQFVSMGAYLLIFPDKLCFNTYTGEVTALEASAPCAAVTVESKTFEGDVSYTKKWVRVKSAADLSALFKEGDGIELAYTESGAEKTVTAVISAIGSDSGAYYCDLTADTSAFENAESITAVTLSRKIPDMDYFAECDNRVWGCSSAKHELYACKLGDPSNWNCFAGLSTDSYAVTVGSDGEFTGAVNYAGNVLFFKEGCIHKVYGTKPANFQITETVCRGIKKGSAASAAVVGEILYYHAAEGIMAYGGSYPQLVSGAFGGEAYSEAKGGGRGSKYYVSLKRTSDGAEEAFCYDSSRQVWHKLSLSGVTGFADTRTALYCAAGSALYFIDGSEPPAWKMPDPNGAKQEWTEEPISAWYLESGDLAIDLPDKKHISRIQLKLSAENGCTVKLQYDGGVFEKAAEVSAGTKQPVVVPIIPRRCDRMKMRIEGSGRFSLLSAAYTVEQNSEK